MFLLQPAVSVSLVYMGSEIWSRGYGVKSKTGISDPPDHDTIFRIGSISKVFSVHALQLIGIFCMETFITPGSSDVPVV